MRENPKRPREHLADVVGEFVGTTTSADMRLQPKSRTHLEVQNKGTLGLTFSLSRKRGFISAWVKKQGKDPTLLKELKSKWLGPKWGLILMLYSKF